MPRLRLDPKRVIYLWGAGATQEEIDYVGARPINLLMRDSRRGEGGSTRIIKRLSRRWRNSFTTDQGGPVKGGRSEGVCGERRSSTSAMSRTTKGSSI